MIHNINELIAHLKTDPSIPLLLDHIEASSHVHLAPLQGAAPALLLALLGAHKKESSTLVVSYNKRDAERVAEDIRQLVPNPEKVLLFPEWNTLPYDPLSPINSLVHERITTLNHILTSKGPVIVSASLNALMRYTIAPDVFTRAILDIEVGKSYDTKILLRELDNLGYEHVDRVERQSHYARRGSIIDIFPTHALTPFRIDRVGDIIEEIRIIDAESQRSLEKCSTLRILPASEIILDDESVLKAITSIEKRFPDTYTNRKELIDNLFEHIRRPGYENLLPLFHSPASLFDYMKDPWKMVIVGPEIVEPQSQKILADTKRRYNEGFRARHVRLPPHEILINWQEKLEQCPVPILKMGHLVPEIENTAGTWIDPEFRPSHQYKGNIPKLEEDIVESCTKKKNVILLCTNSPQQKRLSAALQTSQDTFPEQFYFLEGSLSTGCIIGNTTILQDREIWGHKKSSTPGKLQTVQSSPIDSFSDLKEGDPVVHINHGVGRFIRIDRKTILDFTRDFILILYADEETLYLPVENMRLVQKYIGSNSDKLRLDKLGGKSWERRKIRARERAKGLAQELIKIYAARKNNPGRAFLKDSPYQFEMESLFEFEETPDQLRAINDVKQDMESTQPMDRLVCGDVGYGKTEVAIRAAFKAIMTGTQVAFLAPTTILVEQHLHNFTKRFHQFPINIDMLSRFRSATEQREIIKKIESGALDLVIGTHRLLSKNINWKDLGLVVIDEEQRFGVEHKEALRKIRNLIDILSLSATPIPRTLHMSLIKLRDMSTIQTPPTSRLAVETYSMEYNEEIVHHAISRELERNGQVFFIFNRVKEIEAFAHSIRNLFPKAKILTAHGQMNDNELDEIMHQFIHGQADILITTTIVENGVDIPNANTILIDRADRFGLGQLYQLRGRVGRSARQAYCYLLYHPDYALSEEAQRRLSAMHEYGSLGGGFQVALRDLEIRGAGNVLGPEQSGDIESVGFDLYTQILDEEVQRLTNEGKDTPQPVDPLIEMRIDRFIPDTYISSTRLKVEIYRKLSSRRSQDEVKHLELELMDRFGPPPPVIKNMLDVAKLQAIAYHLRIQSVHDYETSIVIKPGPHTNIDPSALPKLFAHFGKQLSADSKDGGVLTLILGEDIPITERLRRTAALLALLMKSSVSATTHTEKAPG